MDKRLHEVSLIIPAHPQLQVEMERVFVTYGVFKAAVLEIKKAAPGSMKAPRVGFILYCIPNAACMENWNGFIFRFSVLE